MNTRIRNTIDDATHDEWVAAARITHSPVIFSEMNTQSTTAAAAISAERLEYVSRICEDARKEFAYDKHTGSWAWFDRDEAENVSAWHTGFETRWAAMLEAADPYIEDEEESQSEAEDITDPREENAKFRRLAHEARRHLQAIRPNGPSRAFAEVDSRLKTIAND